MTHKLVKDNEVTTTFQPLVSVENLHDIIDFDTDEAPSSELTPSKMPFRLFSSSESAAKWQELIGDWLAV